MHCPVLYPATNSSSILMKGEKRKWEQNSLQFLILLIIEREMIVIYLLSTTTIM